MHHLSVLSALLLAGCAASPPVIQSEARPLSAVVSAMRDDERSEALERLWQQRGELIPDNARIDRASLRTFLGERRDVSRLSPALAAATFAEVDSVSLSSSGGQVRRWTFREIERLPDGRFTIVGTLTSGSTFHRESFLMRRTDPGAAVRFTVLALELSQFGSY